MTHKKEVNISSIEGVVSPLKRRAGGKSSRGGKEASKATAKEGNYLGGRGGYKQSGTGSGRNPGGYNIHTRFQPRKTPAAPGGGGTTKKTTPQKPYSFDKDGNIVINNYIDGKGGTQNQSQSQTQGTEGYWTYKDVTTTKKIGGSNRESYKEVWERKKDKYTTKGQKSRMGTDENAYNVFANIDEYIDYMERVKEYNKTEEGKKWSEENRKSSKERTITSTERVKDKWIPGTSGTQTQSQTQIQN